MSLVASDKGANFTPAPEGSHVAICCRVIDLGTQFSEYYNKAQHKVLIGWELPNERQEDGSPFMVSRRYTLSLSKNSSLRADLEAWRGRAFSPDELKAFDLKNLLGKPCMVNVQHDDRDGQKYANVEAVMALPKGTTVPASTNKPVYFDVENFDKAVFDGFSDNLKKTIENSEERKKLREPAKGAAALAGASASVGAGMGLGEDDIPF
jgi:hypothetical protein